MNWRTTSICILALFATASARACGATDFDMQLAAISVLASGLPLAAGGSEHAVATYYPKGKKTADGERFRTTDMTAAKCWLNSEWLNFNSLLCVRSKSGRVTVRVNDRGPFTRSSVGPGKDLKCETHRIDLTPAAFKKIADVKKGLGQGRVDVEISAGECPAS